MTSVGVPSGDPNDIRFQFEIIRQLAENGRVMASNIGELQKTQFAMLERMARIEANTVNEAVARLETRVDAQSTKIDKLEQIEDRRAGGSATKQAIVTWWPVIGVVLLVFYTAARALGFVHIPDPPQREPRQIERSVR